MVGNSPTPVNRGAGSSGGPQRTQGDRSRWHLLLAVPVVVPLVTALYNTLSPRLFGIPAFYWVQLAFIGLGVATTVAVYLLTRERR